MDILRAGRTLLLREFPESNPHLWLVLTDPVGKPAQVVAVMVRTVTAFTDRTVVLNAGDHPFIRHPSSVHYSTATFFRVRAIQRSIRQRQCYIQEDMSPELLQRVCRGLLSSPFTVNAVREHCQESFDKTR